MGLPTPWFWTSGPQDCERICFRFLRPGFVHGSLRQEGRRYLGRAVPQRRRCSLGFTLSCSKDLKVQWKTVVFLGGHVPHFSLLKAFYDASQCFNLHTHFHGIRVWPEPKKKACASIPASGHNACRACASALSTLLLQPSLAVHLPFVSPPLAPAF